METTLPRRLTSLVAPLALITCLLAGHTEQLALAQLAPPSDELGTPHDSVDDPYRPHVAVQILGMGRRRLIRLKDAAVHVELVNTRSDAVDVDLVVDVQAHGIRRSHDGGTHRIAGGALAAVDLPISDLGITPDRLETPAILTLRVVSRDDAGNEIDGVVSPAYYLHQHRRAGVMLYDERTLMRRFRGGDLQGLFVDARGRDAFPKQMKIFAGQGGGAYDPFAPAATLSSGEQTICIHWDYQSRDHGAGERYYAQGQPMAAHGVKVTVAQDGQSVKTLYADPDTGCVSLPLASGVAKLTVAAEARLGVNENIYVATYDSPQEKKDKKTKRWTYHFVTGPETVHLHVPVGVSSTLMAFGSFAAYQLDHLAPITKDAAQLDLVYVAGTTNSDATATEARFSDNQGDRKFVYGHEIGHWYGLNQGFDFEAGYSWISNAAPCWSENGDAVPARWHLLRSTEMNTAAFKEGLAHFFSTLVWNGRARPKPIFRYYKNLAPFSDADGYYGDLHAAANRVDMAAADADPDALGGTRNWRDNVCWQDDSNRFSVELDWTRFLMNYLDGDTWADVPGDDPTFAQVIDLIRLAYDGPYLDDVNHGEDKNRYKYAIYSYVEEALHGMLPPDSALLDRWELLAERYGVKPLAVVP